MLSVLNVKWDGYMSALESHIAAVAYYALEGWEHEDELLQQERARMKRRQQVLVSSYTAMIEKTPDAAADSEVVWDHPGEEGQSSAGQMRTSTGTTNRGGLTVVQPGWGPLTPGPGYQDATDLTSSDEIHDGRQGCTYQVSSSATCQGKNEDMLYLHFELLENSKIRLGEYYCHSCWKAILEDAGPESSSNYVAFVAPYTDGSIHASDYAQYLELKALEGWDQSAVQANEFNVYEWPGSVI